MKPIITLICFFLIASTIANAQASKRDSILLSKFNAKGTYPLIKSSKFCGVMPVDNVTDKPDPSVKYKLLFDFSKGTNDSVKAKDINRGLVEIGRIINLQIVAGVPRENLELVIVTHGRALFSLLSAEAFKKQFKAENPNITIIQELESAGAKFVACGQAMQFQDIDRSSLPPNIRVAIAAKVALSTYQQKGYTTYEIADE